MQVRALGQYLDANLRQLGRIARQHFLGTARQHGKEAGTGDGVVGMQCLATRTPQPRMGRVPVSARMRRIARISVG